MKDILEILKAIVLMTLIILAFFIGMFKINNIINDIVNDIANKDEQIKMLEQSLQEQIQEKEVYMKMLKEKGE